MTEIGFKMKIGTDKFIILLSVVWYGLSPITILRWAAIMYLKCKEWKKQSSTQDILSHQWTMKGDCLLISNEQNLIQHLQLPTGRSIRWCTHTSHENQMNWNWGLVIIFASAAKLLMLHLMGGWKEHHGWLVCGSWTAHLFSEMLPLSLSFFEWFSRKTIIF